MAEVIYIDYKRSLGLRFVSDAAVLRSFCRAVGDIAVEAVSAEATLAFIAGSGPVTTRWRLKFSILHSFYRYALERYQVMMPPLPAQLPKLPPPLIPYIYSDDKLKRLVAATETLHTPQSPLRALTLRSLLLLLYGSGLRIGEALALTDSR